MNGLAEYIEACAHTLEQCLLTEDPIAHLATLPEAYEKKLLIFFMQDHSPQFLKDLKTKHKITGQLAETLNEWKIHTQLQRAQKAEDVKYLIDDYLAKNKGAFHHPRPAEFKSIPGHQQQKEPTHPSTLPADPPLNDWVLNQLKSSEERCISELTDTALRTLSADELNKLKIQSRESLMCRRSVFTNKPPQFYLEFIAQIYREKTEGGKVYELPSSVFQMQDREEFLKMLTLIPELVTSDSYLKRWFTINFAQRLSRFKDQLSISEKDEKRVLLLEIIAQIKSLEAPKLRGAL